MNLQSITVEQFFPHAPSRVWRALTEEPILSRWLMPTDFRPEPGCRFSFDTGGWGMVQCEVLEVEPAALLTYSWRNPPLDTLVTWRIEGVEGGTLLRLEHSGFDLDDGQQAMAFEGMGSGWRGDLMKRLDEILRELAAAP